jgi:hypothetical protein
MTNFYVMYDIKVTLECDNGFSLKTIQYDRNNLDVSYNKTEQIAN